VRLGGRLRRQQVRVHLSVGGLCLQQLLLGLVIGVGSGRACACVCVWHSSAG
jgi:hypothetical protein